MMICLFYVESKYKSIHKNNVWEQILLIINDKNLLFATKIDDLPVFSSQDVMQLFGNVLFLIANEKYAGDIKKQLFEAGISKEVVFEYM